MNNLLSEDMIHKIQLAVGMGMERQQGWTWRDSMVQKESFTAAGGWDVKGFKKRRCCERNAEAVCDEWVGNKLYVFLQKKE
jgi:hypothetical protein